MTSSPRTASARDLGGGRPVSAIVDAPVHARQQAATAQAKPTLFFFYSATSGASRKAEGFLATVLQSRRNHETFTLRRIDFQAATALATRLGVQQAPAIVVIEAKRLLARLEGPRGCADIKDTLAPWLR